MNDLAVSYVRVSSKKQDLSRQIKELEDFAEKKNLKVIKCIEDITSASKAFIGERDGFNDLKRFLKSNKNVKNVLVHEVSRLGRKNFEVQNVIEEFYQLGVNIHFRDLNISTLDSNGNKSPESSIIISILGSMAENETRLLAERIKSGLLNSAKNGLAFNKKITGYKKGKDGRPVIDNSDAPMVKRMFELAANETSLYFISKNIIEEFDKEIHPKTINGIIKNSFYKGERKYLGETIPVDKIVDKDTWQKANDFLSSRKKFTKRYRVHENIVEGKIVCYDCNNPMYQIVIEKARCNIFKCSKNCSTSVNRPWLYEMVRYVVDKHTKETNDKEFKENLKIKIKENEQLLADLIKRRKVVETAQLTNYENYLLKNVKDSIYERANDKFERELKTIELNIKQCNEKKKSFKSALSTKPQHFSEDLKTFKVQIQDILKEVEVANDFVILNINNVVQYKIPQINGTKLGWIKRKNKGRKMTFDSPFDTGIEIRNVITDENLEVMINSQSLDDDEIDRYFESEEYRNKIGKIKGLGRKDD